MEEEDFDLDALEAFEEVYGDVHADDHRRRHSAQLLEIPGQTVARQLHFEKVQNLPEEIAVVIDDSQRSQISPEEDIRSLKAIRMPPLGKFLTLTSISGHRARIYTRIQNASDDDLLIQSRRAQKRLTTQSFTAETISNLLESVRMKNLNKHESESDLDVAAAASESSMWVEKYRPSSFSHLLSQTKCNLEVLQWLKSWDNFVFGQGDPQSRPKEPIALIVGAPGNGKTTLAYVIASHCGYNAVEVNASDDRSSKFMNDCLKDISDSSLSFYSSKPKCLILDEIDGSTGGDEKSATQELIKFAQSKQGIRRPVICIANDVYASNMKPLRHPLVKLFRVEPPRTDVMVSRLLQICREEGLKADFSTIYALVEQSQRDIRNCLNTLEFFHRLSSSTEQRAITSSSLKNVAVGRKDSTQELFPLWRQVFTKATTKSQNGKQVMLDVVEAVSSFNDSESINNGLFENYLQMRYSDPTLTRTCEMLDWICFSDSLNHQIRRSSNFFLENYSGFVAGSFHVNAANNFNAKVRFPKALMENQRTCKRNLSILASFVGQSPFCRSAGIVASKTSHELLPFLRYILVPAPKCRPKSLHMLKPVEAQMMRELVDTYVSLRLSFYKETAPNDEAVAKLCLDPDIFSFTLFSGQARHYALPEDFKGYLEKEIQQELIRRAASTAPSQPSKQVEKENCKEQTALPAKRTAHFFSSSTHQVKKKIRKDMTEGIRFRFQEGFTNAVRRPVLLRDFFS